MTNARPYLRHFTADDLYVEADPMIMIGGGLRVSRHVKVMSENWILTGVANGYGVFGAGVRSW